MTLRARLTAAFLAVVLGPVLLGAVFVGITTVAVTRTRATERLATAAASVQNAVSVSCQRLRSAAETAAMLGAAPDGAVDPAGARHAVARALADGIRIEAVYGASPVYAGVLPPVPWADCGATSQFGWYGGLSVKVEIHDRDGSLIGYATAVDTLDAAFVTRLADAGGAEVTVLAADAELSTEDARDAGGVASVARTLAPGAVGESTGGRYVRSLDPEPGQPLPLALSVERGDPQALYAVLVAAVLLAGLAAVGVAWWLARTTIRPLTELAYAVERVAAGDLAARVPVRSHDEVGSLGATFNRMTREMQGYVHALTASRDQLRRQLGVLGDTLSSTHDLHRILRVILQTAAAATGARAGVVLLTDPASGALVGRCAEGLAGRGTGMDADDLRVRLGEGLLGSVAASGEPRCGRVDRDGPTLSPQEPRCLTYVAVPFSAPGAGPTTGLEGPGDPELVLPVARGVLALYDRHGFDEFDDADLTTLRTFAGQAAVALDNVRVHEEAQRLSLTDPLTGLSNYRYLREQLRKEVERASRFGRMLSLLVLDLDRFKDVNDTYGHAAGDAVLAEFARRVRAEIREVDFAFRQGGEEFVVLLPETDTDGGAVVAQRLGDAIRRSPVLVVPSQSADGEPLRVPVTVSIGVAVYPDHGVSGQAVLEAADDALYAAKAAGRDTYRTADDRAPTSPDPP